LGYAVNYGLLRNAGTGEEAVLIEPRDQGHRLLRPILRGSEARRRYQQDRPDTKKFGHRNEQAPCNISST